MSENRTDIVFKLKSKIYRLIALYESLSEKYLAVSQRVEFLEKELAQKEKQLKQLAAENEKLKLAKAFVSTDDSKEAKQKISKIVREIDKCIALLNK